MHPHTFYSTLFQFDKRDEVFVAMSFAPDFDQRWCEVIQPAIAEDLGFTANRVDFSKSGESVIHDILDGAAHARLVLADITAVRMRDRRGQEWPQRNANVLWEVGIAHTMRMPDEVILVRSDDEESIFDLTQFRAFQYDPSDATEARSFLVELMKDRLRAIDQSKSNYVRQVADSVEPYAAVHLMLMPQDGSPADLQPPLGQQRAIQNLFELGLVRLDGCEVLGRPNHLSIKNRCVLTQLGQAVRLLIRSRFSREEWLDEQDDTIKTMPNE